MFFGPKRDGASRFRNNWHGCLVRALVAMSLAPLQCLDLVSGGLTDFGYCGTIINRQETATEFLLLESPASWVFPFPMSTATAEWSALRIDMGVAKRKDHDQ